MGTEHELFDGFRIHQRISNFAAGRVYGDGSSGSQIGIYDLLLYVEFSGRCCVTLWFSGGGQRRPQQPVLAPVHLPFEFPDIEMCIFI